MTESCWAKWARALLLAGVAALVVAGCSGAVSRPSTAAPAEGAPTLQVPVSGEHGTHWTIWQYVDHDATSGVRDYTGGDRSYDGHRGTDFGVPSFRSMDNDLVEILAAAAGRVTVAVDGNVDRQDHGSVESIINTALCTRGGGSNTVAIEHANGYTTTYLHLKKDSLRVTRGDRVQAGDVLGIVGSSGCSTGPHLHFEVRDGRSRVVDPFVADLWSDPPSYETPFGLLEYYVYPGDHDGTISQDPDRNIATGTVGTGVFFAVHLAGVKQGDQIRMTAANGDANGDEVLESPRTASRDRRGSIWSWRPELPEPGEWVFNVSVNDRDMEVNHIVTVVE